MIDFEYVLFRIYTLIAWVLDADFANINAYIAYYISKVHGISLAVTVGLIVGIVYCKVRIKQIRKKEDKYYNPEIETGYDEISKADPKLGAKWELIKKHINSDNPNDWKQAIIDADVILGEILTRLGYQGESIGEQLKRVNPGDMGTIQDAWEAHKARNAIAHGHEGFQLNDRESKRIIGLYRNVFDEFFYVD